MEAIRLSFSFISRLELAPIREMPYAHPESPCTRMPSREQSRRTVRDPWGCVFRSLGDIQRNRLRRPQPLVASMAMNTGKMLGDRKGLGRVFIRQAVNVESIVIKDGVRHHRASSIKSTSTVAARLSTSTIVLNARTAKLTEPTSQCELPIVLRTQRISVIGSGPTYWYAAFYTDFLPLTMCAEILKTASLSSAMCRPRVFSDSFRIC